MTPRVASIDKGMLLRSEKASSAVALSSAALKRVAEISLLRMAEKDVKKL